MIDVSNAPPSPLSPRVAHVTIDCQRPRGERVRVRGGASLAAARDKVQRVCWAPHPDPLPARLSLFDPAASLARGEGAPRLASERKAGNLVMRLINQGG